mmetsp:Transcript_52243/g.113836  ORF Transcript_52243/g.113836 Transcript_52243/m.113836 type:complete len:315 (-) Transcript_52243:137-1081(-)
MSTWTSTRQRQQSTQRESCARLSSKAPCPSPPHPGSCRPWQQEQGQPLLPQPPPTSNSQPKPGSHRQTDDLPMPPLTWQTWNSPPAARRSLTRHKLAQSGRACSGELLARRRLGSPSQTLHPSVQLAGQLRRLMADWKLIAVAQHDASLLPDHSRRLGRPRNQQTCSGTNLLRPDFPVGKGNPSSKRRHQALPGSHAAASQLENCRHLQLESCRPPLEGCHLRLETSPPPPPPLLLLPHHLRDWRAARRSEKSDRNLGCCPPHRSAFPACGLGVARPLDQPDQPGAPATGGPVAASLRANAIHCSSSVLESTLQ